MAAGFTYRDHDRSLIILTAGLAELPILKLASCSLHALPKGSMAQASKVAYTGLCDNAV